MMASHEIIPTKSSSNPQDYLLSDADTSKLTYPDLPEEQRLTTQYRPEDLLGKPRTFTLPDGTKVDISFRRYVEGPEDDAAFQKLDAECRQGKAGLETKFFLSEGWSSFQGDSHCMVAYPVGNPQEIIATCRGFRKWVYLNGIPVPMSYEFLLRLAPKYRGGGIAEMTSRLLLNDDRLSGCRYILGYVVEDNVNSLNVQKKILAGREDTLMTEFKKWYVSGYTPKDIIAKINTVTLPSDSSRWKIYRSADLKEQVDHTKKCFASAQLLPCDLSNIFRSKLSEGTYFVRDENDEVDLASFSVWNSGAVRSSRLPGMKDFLDRPCIFYNVWMNPSIDQQKASDALKLLIKTVAQHLDIVNSHGFIYLFLLNDHPLSTFFEESAKFFISWKARLWYWDALFKHDPSTGCDLAFDPRDALQ